jgi:hypothetical protein
MIKKSSALGTLVLTLAFALPAQAWLHLEPLIGYNKGQFNSSQLQGIGLGLRLGVDIKSIFIAADVEQHTLQQGSINSATYTDQGVTLGLDIKDYRIWYGLITTGSFSYTSGTNNVSESGTGSKFGVSAAISTNTYLNLETRYSTYSTSTTNGISTNVSDLGTVGFLSISYVL